MDLDAQRQVLEEFAPRFAVVSDEGHVLSVSTGLGEFMESTESKFRNHIAKLVKPSLRLALRTILAEAQRAGRRMDDESAALELEGTPTRIGLSAVPLPVGKGESPTFMIIFRRLGGVLAPGAGPAVPPAAQTDLENLLASTQIAMLFLDDSLRIRNFTPALTELYRVRPEDRGREIGDFVSRAVSMPSYPLPVDFDEDPRPRECEVLTPEGRVYLRRIVPYLNHSGTREGIVVNFINVTELRRSEGRFQLLATAAPLIIWMTAGSGEGQYFNQRWYAYTGQTETEKTDWNWPAAVHPDDLARTLEAWRLSLAGGREYHIEYRLRRADGVYRWFEARGLPFRDSGGKILQWFGTCVDIDDKRSEVDLLRESGEALRTIVETVPQLIWRTNPDGSADYVSERFVTYVGRTREDVLGWRWVELVHPEDRAGLVAEWNRARENKRPISVEFRLEVGGRYRWVRSQGNPFFNEKGEVTKYYGTWTDVHESRRALALNDLNKQLLDTMIRTSPAFMCVLEGEELVYDRANDKYLELIGETDAILGRRIEDVLPQLKEEGFLDVLRDIRRTGEPYIGTEVAYNAPRSHGRAERRFVDFVLQPGFGAGGEVERIFVHGNDVTAKVRARTTIENERANFRNLFRQTPEMVCIMEGPEHVFEFVNEAHVRALGFDATGMTVRQAQPESVEVYGLLDGVYATGVTAELFEIPVTLGDRQRFFNLTYACRRNEEGEISGVMILGAEITEQVLWRAELEKAKTSAESANQAKTAFLANMSHEIRTPLGAIVGFSELLAEACPDQPGLSDYVRRILRNSTQLSRLIDELLDLSKIEARRLQIERGPVDLNQAIEDAFAAVEIVAREKSLSFEVRRLSEIPAQVMSDPTRIRQILINLVGNAVKFTPSGGITVEIKVELFEGRRRLVTRVIDTGIGIAPEKLPALFQPFSQADASITRKYGGTGLGLALSRELARLLGGDIYLESSAPGAGSVFVATIDLGEADGVAEDPRS